MGQSLLKVLIEEIREIKATMLTKNDAKNFLTKQDAKNFATKDDLKNLVTLEQFKKELKAQNEDISQINTEIFNKIDEQKAVL